MKLALFTLAAMFALPASLVTGQELVRTHQWQGNHAISYGLDDLDRNAISPDGFAYCHWGNWMDEHHYNMAGQVSLSYSPLTQGPFANVADQDNLNLFLIRGSGHQLNRALFPANTDWSRAGRVSFNVGWFQPSHYTLFRYFHFPSRLTNVVSSSSLTKYVNHRTEKLVVLVHGWNPNRNTHHYLNQYGILSDAIADQLSGTEWQLVQYPWERDADTGPINLSAPVNGSEAAHIGHRHGWHLGELLNTVSPDLKQVHFIAHSAGSWVVRAAVRYLLANRDDLRVEVSLMDPFIPGSLIGMDSALHVPLMSQLAFEPGAAEQLVQLGSYYSAGTDLTQGTHNTFQWRDTDLNLRVDWARAWPPARFYQDHDGPIEFFADSVSAVADPDNVATGLSKFNDALSHGYGWRLSLFMNEPVFTLTPDHRTLTEGQHAMLSGLASSRNAMQLDAVDPPTTSYGWEKLGDSSFSAHGPHLILSHVTSADAGLYRVYASNHWGVTRSPWALVLVHPADPCGGHDDAQFISEGAPHSQARMAPGQTFTKTWTLENVGATAWGSDCGHRFRRISGADWGHPDEIAWTDDMNGVGPGQTVTWEATFTAPTEPGAYSATWSMYRLDDGPFGPSLNLTIVVDETSDCIGDDAAEAVAGTGASPVFTLQPGESMAYSLDVENTGQSIWSELCGHAWQSLEGEHLLADGWQTSPDTPIPPDSVWTQSITVTAPQTVGLYPFRAQLHSHRSGPFGPEIIFYVNVPQPIPDCPPDAYTGHTAPGLAFNLGSADGVWLSDVAGPGRLEQPTWFQIHVPWPTDHITLTGTYTFVEQRLTWTLYDAHTNWIADSLFAGDGMEVASASVESGTYYIHVQPETGESGACIDYDFVLGHSMTNACPPHAYGPNTEQAHAYDIRFYAGVWLFDVNGPGQVYADSWYRIQAHAGYQRLFVYAELLDASSSSPSLDLFDATGEWVTTATGLSDDVILDYTVEEPGHYYVRVRGLAECAEYDLWWDDLYTHPADLWLTGHHLELPLATTGQVGRLAGSGAKEGIRIIPPGTTNTLHRLLSLRMPIQHHIIEMGDYHWRDGDGWSTPGTVTDHSSDTWLEARISGWPHPDLKFQRRVYFAADDWLITVADTYSWFGDTNSPLIWAMDTVNPDLDLETYGTYETRNWLDSALRTNDSAWALADQTGWYVALASGSPSATLDSVGMQNTQPEPVWAAPLDANKELGDDSISVVQPVGPLAPNESQTYVAYWGFGMDANALMTVLRQRMQKDDHDGDGIPDIWEYQHYGHATGADAETDPISDGLSNWQHYIAGTDPFDPEDRLRAWPMIQDEAEDSIRLQFRAKANRTYRVWGRNQLTKGDWQPVSFHVDSHQAPLVALPVQEKGMVTIELGPFPPFPFIRLDVTH